MTSKDFFLLTQRSELSRQIIRYKKVETVEWKKVKRERMKIK